MSGLNIHSYSPSREYVPFCNHLNFRVNRGPNSFNPTFSVSLNTYPVIGVLIYLVRSLYPPFDILTMPPHKDEITLVVECHHLSSFKFGYLGHQCLEHTTNSVTKSGIEVVQNELWVMCCNDAFALDDDDNNRQFTETRTHFHPSLTGVFLAGV